MLTALAIQNYRSLNQLVLPLDQLNIITGANGSGKSNLYKALRLLAETAQGGVIHSVAREGGLESSFWAGPEKLSRRMKNREVPIQGLARKKDAVRLRLGFSTDDYSYAISLGLPIPSASAFALDPEIKRECIWAGSQYRPASLLIDRDAAVVKTRSSSGRGWDIVRKDMSSFDSIFSQISDPAAMPEVYALREEMKNWRFYDHFRSDREAPARIPQLGTRTPVLHNDGRDLAAALQTIREIGDEQALHDAIEDAFPGARVDIEASHDARFAIKFYQEGLLRPLSGAELSDGTLRFLLWVAALLTPRPPPLMVLNEPETSLHPDLLPALARLIIKASRSTQVWVVSHASRLVAALNEAPDIHTIGLEKNFGQTEIVDQGILDIPNWHWPD